MKKDGRYDVSGLPEAEFEPGSNGQVLKNLLGIKSAREMDEAEARALERVMVTLVGKYDEKHRFTAADIRAIHKSWLREIYEWAGEYRRVNVSKGDFPFAAAARIPALMEEFEGGMLARHTPCHSKERIELIRALAETHVELVLIHPLREGNGRVARVLSTCAPGMARYFIGESPMARFCRAEGKEKGKGVAGRRGLKEVQSETAGR